MLGIVRVALTVFITTYLCSEVPDMRSSSFYLGVRAYEDTEERGGHAYSHKQDAVEPVV